MLFLYKHLIWYKYNVVLVIRTWLLWRLFDLLVSQVRRYLNMVLIVSNWNEIISFFDIFHFYLQIFNNWGWNISYKKLCCRIMRSYYNRIIIINNIKICSTILLPKSITMVRTDDWMSGLQFFHAIPVLLFCQSCSQMGTYRILEVEVHINS